MLLSLDLIVRGDFIGPVRIPDHIAGKADRLVFATLELFFGERLWHPTAGDLSTPEGTSALQLEEASDRARVAPKPQCAGTSCWRWFARLSPGELRPWRYGPALRELLCPCGR